MEKTTISRCVLGQRHRQYLPAFLWLALDSFTIAFCSDETHDPLQSFSATTIGPATSSLFFFPDTSSTIVSANSIAVPGLRMSAPLIAPISYAHSPSTRNHLPIYHNPILTILPPRTLDLL